MAATELGTVVKRWLVRWKYRLIVWFFDRPDALARRVAVENRLLAHYTKRTSPTPEECRDLALRLGTASKNPKWSRP